MKTLKLFIKRSFFNKINNFMCCNIINIISLTRIREEDCIVNQLISRQYYE